MGYSWDAVGNLLAKTDSGGTIAYGYDAAEEVTSVTDRQSRSYSLGYNQDGERTSVTLPNGVAEALGYDLAGQLTSIGASKSGSTLTSFSYSYAKGTQTTQLVQSRSDVINTSVSGDNVNASWSYGYDAANNLTLASETGSAAHTYAYAYDADAGLTSKTVDGTTTTLSYNAVGELTQTAGGTNRAYNYDSSGRLAGRSDGFGATYNAAGQATSMTPGGRPTYNMVYTGANQSERTAADSSTVQYDLTGPGVMNYATPSTITFPAPPPGTNYITTTPDGLDLSDQTSSTTYYPLDEGSGSTAAVTDASGNVIQTVTYDAQGNPVYTNVEPNVPSYPVTVDGMQCDTQTGLCNTGGGYYDTTTGQPSACDGCDAGTLGGSGGAVLSEDVQIPGWACGVGGVIIGPLCCISVAHCWGWGAGGGGGR